MKITSSTQRYCGFDCLGLSINTIWYWISKTLYNCFVPGRQERSQVPRISGHAEMVCNFTLTDIQFDSSWKLGWLGEENIAHTGWFPNCASPFSVPKWKRGGAFKNLTGDQLKTSLCTRICGGKMYFVFFVTRMKLSGDWFCIFSARRRGDCLWLTRWNCQGCLEAFSSKSLQKEIISLKPSSKSLQKGNAITFSSKSSSLPAKRNAITYSLYYSIPPSFFAKGNTITITFQVFRVPSDLFEGNPMEKNLDTPLVSLPEQARRIETVISSTASYQFVGIFVLFGEKIFQVSWHPNADLVLASSSGWHNP